MSLFPALVEPSDLPAIQLPDGELSYRQLASAASALASRLPGDGPLAVWADAELGAVVGTLAGLSAGVPVVPLNPQAGPGELEHVLADVRPTALVGPADVQLPGIATLTWERTTRAAQALLLPDARARDAALIVYTSGTTGPPKGVVLSVAAIAANLDGLAGAWAWSASDALVHALPLSHVPGLVFGTLGPLRVGGRVQHLGAFDPVAVAAAFAAGATMLSAVPAMYRRLADAAEWDAGIADDLRHARLLVSGSAPLPGAEHFRIERACGQRIAEHYGTSETLMITAVRADGRRRAGTVGRPLPEVEVRIVDDEGRDLPADGESVGELLTRGPSLFDGYLGAPEATAAAFSAGWFKTGDLATHTKDGFVSIVGRRPSG